MNKPSYFVGIVVRHGFQFYLSKVRPGTDKKSDGPEWYAYIGPQLAQRFVSEEDAVKAVNDYVKKRTDVLGGVGAVSFFKPAT